MLNEKKQKAFAKIAEAFENINLNFKTNLVIVKTSVK